MKKLASCLLAGIFAVSWMGTSVFAEKLLADEKISQVGTEASEDLRTHNQKVEDLIFEYTGIMSNGGIGTFYIDPEAVDWEGFDITTIDISLVLPSKRHLVK